MGNNNIKGLFDALAPSTAQKEKIYYKIVSATYGPEHAGTGGNIKTRPRQRVSRLRPAFAGSVVGVAVLVLCVWALPNLLNSPIDHTPNDPLATNTPIIPNNDPDDPPALTPDNPIPGAVYHNIDPAQLSYEGEPGRVPFGFFFAHRLLDLANNETGINLNNGVRWENGQFAMEDTGNALQTVVNAPALPYGDYTFEQKIMIDEATGSTIAYQTVYTYFTLETMVFQRSFSVFYFSLDDFMRRDYANLEQSANIVSENGQIIIHDFPTPVVNASTRVPHKRELVCFNNGSAIVIEAITAPIMIDDGTVDATRSFERYEQSDKEIMGIMRSLVKNH